MPHRRVHQLALLHCGNTDEGGLSARGKIQVEALKALIIQRFGGQRILLLTPNDSASQYTSAELIALRRRNGIDFATVREYPTKERLSAEEIHKDIIGDGFDVVMALVPCCITDIIEDLFEMQGKHISAAELMVIRSREASQVNCAFWCLDTDQVEFPELAPAQLSA